MNVRQYDFAGACFCFVRTAIEYQEDFVLVVCDTLLRRNRLEARTYESFLVAGRHDDAGPESRIRRCKRHREKDSPRSIRPCPRS